MCSLLDMSALRAASGAFLARYVRTLHIRKETYKRDLFLRNKRHVRIIWQISFASNIKSFFDAPLKRLHWSVEKETYKREIFSVFDVPALLAESEASEETCISEKIYIKETYSEDLTYLLWWQNQRFQKRHIRTKRDIYIRKETCERDAFSVFDIPALLPASETSKETYMYTKRDIHILKETYKRNL